MLLWAQKAARDQAQGNYGDDVGGMRAQAIAAGLIKCVLPSLPVSAGARAWLRLACGELSHKAGPSRRPLSIARRFCGQKPVTTIKWGSVERFGTRSPTCRHVISVYYLLAAYLLRFATSASRVCVDWLVPARLPRCVAPAILRVRRLLLCRCCCNRSMMEARRHCSRISFAASHTASDT